MTDSQSPSLPSPDPATDVAQASRSRLISSVLSPAVRLWLRSQLEQVEHLQVNLEAGDRQLLSGTVQRVTVKAQNAVYRGLHLAQVELTGEQIQTNLRQLMRGQPLRLSQSFPIAGMVRLTEADLNQSLRSPLLAQAVTDFLLLLLSQETAEQAGGKAALTLEQPQITLQTDSLTLVAHLGSTGSKPTPIALRTGLQLASAQALKLIRPQLLPHATARQGLPLRDFDGYTIDLGSQVSLTELMLEPGQLACCGQILVTPAE
jgi:hypothetical protein